MGLTNIKKIRLFKEGGIELFQDDLDYLKNNENIFVSKGENFDDQTQLLEYEVMNQLGEGGFGRVFLGVHKKTGEKVALKFIKERFIGIFRLFFGIFVSFFIENTNDITRIFSEASALKNLMHPNIVTIKNFFTMTNMQFIFVMEYLEGGELKEYVASKGNLDEEEAQMIFGQIVDAIFYCHRQQIIHRDLKLENILLESLETKVIKVMYANICFFIENS
jgi:MAP/microtubule affinity-regulating kinase